MMFESTEMKDLHEIRERHYELTKNMSVEERLNYIKEKANLAENEMKFLIEKKAV